MDVLDTPQFRRYSDPFAAGAKKVAAKTETSTRFVGGQSPFDDSARAKEQANTLLSKGYDHLMAAAAAGNYGVFEAAKAKARSRTAWTSTSARRRPARSSTT